MTATAILAREWGAEIKKSARQPAFALPTVLMPVVFYTLFGITLARGDNAASYLLATFGVFAALGPSVFGFGISIATEREQGLLALKAVSPMPGFVYPVSKLLMTFVFVAIVLAMIYAVGIFAGGVSLSPRAWAAMIAVHLVSVVPFSLIGITLGYLMTSQVAIAIANIVFFLLAILGGLWMPVFTFPGFMQTMAWALPSFHLAQLALIAQGMVKADFLWAHIGAIAAWTLVLTGLVAWAVRRARD
ncbi:hypothetical protein sos41_29010 [Alphaproteobacteria bacterium SO-S41]|nr:hypothetical protein sos41_29010 [Alphaproteobacteria bacterium SO-S41]